MGSQHESGGQRDFQSFMGRLRSHDSGAVEQLFDDYAQRLVGLASKNIHPALVKRFDGEDVVQSVFRTFFRRHQNDGFALKHSQQLWQLLVALTLCKTRSQARKHTADRRNAQRDHAAASDEFELLAQQPSPAEALTLWEELAIALDGLPDRTADIVSMRLEGRTRKEIAAELNLSRQSIHRILKLVQQRLEQRFTHYSATSAKDSEKIADSG